MCDPFLKDVHVVGFGLFMECVENGNYSLYVIKKKPVKNKIMISLGG